MEHCSEVIEANRDIKNSFMAYSRVQSSIVMLQGCMEELANAEDFFLSIRILCPPL
jgi:hypothetical protein